MYFRDLGFCCFHFKMYIILSFHTDAKSSMEVIGITALACGLICVGTCNEDVTTTILQVLMEKAESSDLKVYIYSFHRFAEYESTIFSTKHYVLFEFFFSFFQNWEKTLIRPNERKKCFVL